MEHHADVEDDDVCNNCFREIGFSKDKGIYACRQKKLCIYATFGNTYYMCSNCYGDHDEDIKDDLDQANKMKFIMKKFLNSISATS